MTQKKKRCNNNIFSSYISPPIPKTQQSISKLLVLRACVRPQGKKQHRETSEEPFEKNKKLHAW